MLMVNGRLTTAKAERENVEKKKESREWQTLRNAIDVEIIMIKMKNMKQLEEYQEKS